jgi:tyrosine-protein kinase Etk/Wzc
VNQIEINNSSEQLLVKIIKWRRPLLIITISAVIVSTIIAFLMAPQYKSTATVFPTRSFSISKLLIEQNIGNQEDYMQIGDEDDCEKLLQILNSDQIKTLVADKYNLWEAWKVEKDKYASHYLKIKWDDHVHFKRTDFNSIKIEVHDYIANRSADVANSIVDYVDSIKNNMMKGVAQQAFEIVDAEYKATVASMNEIEDSLQVLRQLGVMDYKTDVEAYTKSYAKALEKGSGPGIKALEEKLNILKKYGGAYNMLSENLRKYRFKFPVIKSKYDEALVNVNRNLPFKFVVDRATPNEYKAKPVRWLIIAISGLSAFMMGLIILTMSERLKLLKNKIQ